MKDIDIKEVMVDISDYATIAETETLAHAIKELKKAQNDSNYEYKHRAVLVYDDDGKISGKLSMFDIIKALEPKYQHFEHSDRAHGHIGLSRFGLNHQFLNSFVDSFDLWNESLETLVKKAGKILARDVMYSPTKAEYVKLDAPIAEAIHQFILGCHQSLLVTKGDEVVGVLRLADIFSLISDVAS